MPAVNPLPPLRYLPVDAGGRRYGIPLDDIQAVLRVDEWMQQDGGTQSADESQESQPPAADPVPIYDLAYLLEGVSHSGRRLHTIVIHDESGVSALLVNAVYPIRSAPSGVLYEVPALVGRARHLFRCLVAEEEQSLILVLDSRWLRLRLAGPASAAEVLYTSH